MIPVIEAWRDLLEARTRPSPNQISFNNLLKRLGPLHGLKHELLPKSTFPVGKLFQDSVKERKNNPKQKRSKQGDPLEPLSPSVVAFHNNFCEKECNKTQRAIALGLWQNGEGVGHDVFRFD